METEEAHKQDDFSKCMEKLTQFNDSGAVTLTKASRTLDSQFRLIRYTPENVLLTLALSTSKDVDNM